MFHYQQGEKRTNPIFLPLCLLLCCRSGWMRCAAHSLSPTVRKPSGSSKRHSTTPSSTTSTRARSAVCSLKRPPIKTKASVTEEFLKEKLFLPIGRGVAIRMGVFGFYYLLFRSRRRGRQALCSLKQPSARRLGFCRRNSLCA